MLAAVEEVVSNAPGRLNCSLSIIVPSEIVRPENSTPVLVSLDLGRISSKKPDCAHDLDVVVTGEICADPILEACPIRLSLTKSSGYTEIRRLQRIFESCKSREEFTD